MFIYPAEPDRVSEIKQFMDHIGTNEAIVKGGVRNRTSFLQIMRLVCCHYTTPHFCSLLLYKWSIRTYGFVQASGLEPENL
jgi:hypothetical protein